jgi:hypothetical protein
MGWYCLWPGEDPLGRQVKTGRPDDAAPWREVVGVAGDVTLLVLREGLRLGAMGGALGLAAAFALTRLLSGFVFGVTATDPLSFLSAVAFLSCSSFSRATFPRGARRASTRRRRCGRSREIDAEGLDEPLPQRGRSRD